MKEGDIFVGQLRQADFTGTRGDEGCFLAGGMKWRDALQGWGKELGIGSSCPPG
ncbi:MAG: hypothetical protein V1706_15375 [Pseudomonadota bacterium]